LTGVAILRYAEQAMRTRVQGGNVTKSGPNTAIRVSCHSPGLQRSQTDYPGVRRGKNGLALHDLGQIPGDNVS
jgi:hypothetical protein